MLAEHLREGRCREEVIDVGVGREEVFVIASAKPKSIIVSKAFFKKLWYG
jgi:hypothetical protein